MNDISEKAYAKLNISLDVSGRRSDGYHNMKMVMQTISLCDELSISVNETGFVRARMNMIYIPGDDRNLAVRAAKKFFAAVRKENYGATIEIRKKIPVGAGLAGGSADAAAVLRCLNRIFGYPLSSAELLKVSEEIGSDVPFCTLGGTAFAEGRGEILTVLNPFPECEFVVCKPDFAISTPEFFRYLDRDRIRIHPDTKGIIASVEKADLKQICRRMYNVFENVNDRRLKVVAEIKGKLLDSGALGAVMTGTGSAVFGVFEKGSVPEKLCGTLGKEYGFCTVAEPVGKLI